MPFFHAGDGDHEIAIARYIINQEARHVEEVAQWIEILKPIFEEREHDPKWQASPKKWAELMRLSWQLGERA